MTGRKKNDQFAQFDALFRDVVSVSNRAVRERIEKQKQERATKRKRGAGRAPGAPAVTKGRGRKSDRDT